VKDRTNELEEEKQKTRGKTLQALRKGKKEKERGRLYWIETLCEKENVALLPLLQAPQFCQQWHLYLLNALLIPCHICCCKLLLRPIIHDEEKGTEMGPESSGSLLMEEKESKISGTSLSLVSLDRCFLLSLFMSSVFIHFPVLPLLFSLLPSFKYPYITWLFCSHPFVSL